MTNMTRTVKRIMVMLEQQGAVVKRTKSGYRVLSRRNGEAWMTHSTPQPSHYVKKAREEVARLGYEWTL